MGMSVHKNSNDKNIMSKMSINVFKKHPILATSASSYIFVYLSLQVVKRNSIQNASIKSKEIEKMVND